MSEKFDREAIIDMFQQLAETLERIQTTKRTKAGMERSAITVFRRKTCPCRKAEKCYNECRCESLFCSRQWKLILFLR